MYARVENTEPIMYGKVKCELKPLSCTVQKDDELTIVVRVKGKDSNLITDIVKDVSTVSIYVGDHIEVNAKILDESEMKRFAVRLGFKNHMELMVYVWDNWGLPYHGKLVRW